MANLTDKMFSRFNKIGKSIKENNIVDSIKDKMPKKDEVIKKDEKAPTDGSALKCSGCGKYINKKDMGEYKICPECLHYFRIGAKERIKEIADAGSFIEFDKGMKAKNPLNYPNYEEKLVAMREKTGINDAVVTGECTICGQKTVIGVMDSGFIMGSMGSVVGEKLTRAFEYATEKSLPAIIFCASGGARMQEGVVSLMQMAKVSAACAKHSDAGNLYISVLTDPTTGGVSASFAMLGDIIIAEPKALIGFAGRRVIEQTIKQKLPDEFQTAEFLLEHGFIDKIIERERLSSVLGKILKIHSAKGGVVENE